MDEGEPGGIDPRRAACLLAVVEEGSIRGAATRLAVEPSSVSRQMAALEKSLGTSLLERGRRGVRLTEAGQLVIDSLRRQRAELEALRADLDELKGMRRGMLTVAVGEGFIADFVGSALKSFARDFPGISFSVQTGTSDAVTEAIVADRAQIGVAYNPVPNERLRTVVQRCHPLKLLAARESRFLDRTTAVSVDALREWPCALLSRGSGIQLALAQAEVTHGFRFNAVLETASIPMLKHFVREALGVTFLPEFVVARELLDGSIEARDLPLGEPTLGEAHLLVRRGRTLPAIARTLSERMQHEMTAFGAMSA